jgi:hypothetical protein
MQRSARRVMLDVWSATARRVGRIPQPVGPHLSVRPPARANEHPHQVCDGDQRNEGDFGDGHGRFLIVVIGGRIGSLARRIAAKCEVAHTAARNAAMRELRAAWAQLIADEVCGRSIGYWLR